MKVEGRFLHNDVYVVRGYNGILWAIQRD